MKILMQLQPDAYMIPGGHQVQMKQTVKHLIQRGHEVTVSHDSNMAIQDADVIHGLGMSPSQVRQARQHRTPVVQSTIWWPLAYRNGSQAPPSASKIYQQFRRRASEYLRLQQGRIEDLPGFQQRLAFESSDVLLPNSPSEAASIIRDLRVTTPIQCVPNGVDIELFSPIDATRGDYILMAGRIEPHKNQLGTIAALKTQSLPIVVVGPAHPHHHDYYKACQAALRHNDQMLGRVPIGELVDLQRRAGVHVLNSWFETTGLASLEAAACGTPVVTTSRGFAYDYFANDAFYCDPATPATVVAAVSAAIGSVRPTLISRVQEHFTWEQAAHRTEKAYRVAVGDLPPASITDHF